MHFHDKLASLPIAGAEDHKSARLKVDVGVRLALESRQRVEEEHAWLEAEMEACLIEEARMKSEEEEQACSGLTDRHTFPKKQCRNQRNISAQG